MAGIKADSTVTAARLSPADNVATLLMPVAASTSVAVHEMSGGGGHQTVIIAADEIFAGHKIALRNIGIGEDVIKYGFPIGRAGTAIAVGEHVHIHNLTSTISCRSAPDKQKKIHRVDADRLRGFVMRCLSAAAVDEVASEHVADHLIEAHLRGVETHGLRRLKPYLSRIATGAVDVAANPVIERIGAVLRIDGRNAIGHHVGAVAADAVAASAGETGVAVAIIRNSNHFGFAGYYATRIAAHSMLAIVASNGQVCLGPDGAKRAILSNDPVAVAAPLGNGSFFEFDMATSVTSRANVVRAAQLGKTLAPGVALDLDGNPTTDAAAALEGVLLAFGGDKGFGFITAIELLCGILTGGAYADLVASKESDPDAPEGTGHFMLAIDLDRAIGRENFESRLKDMIKRIASLPMKSGFATPRYPGQRRWALRAERLENRIPLSASDYREFCALADELGVSLHD